MKKPENCCTMNFHNTMYENNKIEYAWRDKEERVLHISAKIGSQCYRIEDRDWCRCWYHFSYSTYTNKKNSFNTHKAYDQEKTHEFSFWLNYFNLSLIIFHAKFYETYICIMFLFNLIYLYFCFIFLNYKPLLCCKWNWHTQLICVLQFFF